MVEGGEDVAARLVEVLAPTARKHVVANSPRGGWQVVRGLDRSLTAPCIDPERVEALFGNKHNFPGIDHLKHIARIGVPVDVLPGGDLTKELEYGNHPSAIDVDETGWEQVVADVAGGRAIGFPKEQAGQVLGLQVSLLGVVEEHENIRIVHDVTFEHSDGEKRGSVNAIADWDESLACALAGVMRSKFYRGFSVQESSSGTEHGFSF